MHACNSLCTNDYITEGKTFKQTLMSSAVVLEMKIGEKIILEDVKGQKSSKNVWNIPDDVPSIKQIYGTFFPPYHMKYFEQYIKHVHSNPHAHHDTNGYIQSKIESMNINQEQFDNFLTLCESITIDTKGLLKEDIKTRNEKSGAVIWTGYHNGFFVNKKGKQVLELCDGKHALVEIADTLKSSIAEIKAFLIRLIAFGIINVHA